MGRCLFSSRSSFRAKSFQKRSSASLISLVNRVPQNVFNDRIDEMMLLMKTNDETANEVLAAYIDDADDVQAMLGALDGCLRDVYGNLRDSFGRFVFTDAYKRWTEYNII